ncbi:MAG: glycosyltransferase [Desulfobacterales bacterium]|nr:glycosyltransferase [Desulfobacterales bacterium]
MQVLFLTGMYPNLINPLNGAIVEAQRQALEALGVKTGLVHLRPKDRTELLNALSKLRQSLRNSEYDLVHVHYGLSALVLSLFQNLPVVATFHGTDVNGVSLKSKNGSNIARQILFSLAARLNRQLSRSASAVIVMSHEMKARLPSAVHPKTWVAPMGVDTRFFFQRSRQEAREKLGWVDEPVVVFCNNNSEAVKRQDLAEKAVAVARKSFPSLKLFILKGIAREKVPWVLSAADCLLVTSDKEGSPNIVRESLACNLPLVSVPVGDLKELISDHPSAGILTERNPDSIANGMMDVLARERPDNLKAIIQGHTAAANALRIKRIYEQVLENRSNTNYSAFSDARPTGN